MAQKNVFLKRLEIIETLGAATVIAADKTGTLTKNDMTCSDLWYNSQYTSGMPDVRQSTVSKKRQKNSSVSSTESSVIDLFDEPLPILLRAMCLCNKAKMQMVDDAYEVDAPAPQEQAQSGLSNDAPVIQLNPDEKINGVASHIKYKFDVKVPKN